MLLYASNRQKLSKSAAQKVNFFYHLLYAKILITSDQYKTCYILLLIHVPVQGELCLHD